MATYSVLIRSGVRGATGAMGDNVNQVCIVDDSASVVTTDVTGVADVLTHEFTAGTGNLIEVHLEGELSAIGDYGTVFFQSRSNGTLRGVCASSTGKVVVSGTGIAFRNDSQRVTFHGYLIPIDPSVDTNITIRFILDTVPGNSSDLSWTQLGYTLR